MKEDNMFVHWITFVVNREIDRIFCTSFLAMFAINAKKVLNNVVINPSL